MTVKILKLVTGEELLATVSITNQGENYQIKNAVMVALVPNRTNPQQPSIGLAPWMPYAENEPVSISKEHIVYEAKPVKEMINQYNSIFGGIITPTKSIIL